MENNNHRSYTALAVILAIGFIIGAFIISSTWRKVSRGSVTITVTGSASKDIKSDLGIWSGSFSNQSESLTDAYAKLQQSNTQVKAYLISKGFNDNDIVFTSISTTSLHEPSKSGDNFFGNSSSSGKVIGYRLTQSVKIESPDVDKINKLSREATELINQGIEFESSNPKFLYTKLGDLKIEMIGLASQDAKNRAEQIAKSTGDKIGDVRASKTGVMQINAKNDTQVSDMGMNDETSLEKTITAVVNISFSID